jgi:hypothetical protein
VTSGASAPRARKAPRRPSAGTSSARRTSTSTPETSSLTVIDGSPNAVMARRSPATTAYVMVAVPAGTRRRASSSGASRTVLVTTMWEVRSPGSRPARGILALSGLDRANTTLLGSQTSALAYCRNSNTPAVADPATGSREVGAAA